MPAGKLRDYAAKRRFDTTPEPGPDVPTGGDGPLLFVVQQHDASRLHYDFRLECDGVLKSWAVPKGPSLDPAQKHLAVPTEDHPYDYASFEGVIPPKQYGAGEVIVWDCGVYSPDENGTWFHDRARAEAEVREGIAKGKLSLQLRGEKLKGSFALVKTRQDKSWLLIKHKDRFATTDVVTRRDRSVLSNAAVAELKAVPVRRIEASRLVPSGKIVALPAKLAPMLAELGEKVFAGADWSWEPKLDGYRVLAFIGPDGVKLKSRRGLDLDAAFPRLCADLERDGVPGTILDGEIVAFDPSGKPSFNALQNRVQLKTPREIAAADATVPTAFFVFDLPFFAGVDLRRAPYRDRRRYLAQCVLPGPLVQLVHAMDDGPGLLDAALASGFEGVMAKRKESVYEDGRRSGAWLKIKPTQTAEFVIGGFTTSAKSSRIGFGALIVGTYEKGKLRAASHVGSGFDDRTLKSLRRKLDERVRKTCPFAEMPVLNAPATWVEPELVAEVEFHSWTGDGALRAPVFKRLRDDVDPRKVKRLPPPFVARTKSGAAATPGSVRATNTDEISSVLTQLESPKKEFTLLVGQERVKLTHLDRVYWPENKALEQPALTKRDLLRYLAQVSPMMLPHLAARPLTMIRMPDGIHGQRFFQKHWEQARPAFVDTITVWSGHKEDEHEYLVCNNLPTLLWLGQSGTLEFHIWHSRAERKPDAMKKGIDFASSAESMAASVLNFPDYVVFDIDPYIYSGKEKAGAEPELNTIAFEKGKEVAFLVRELLNSMGLEPIVKLSGKTGLHVFLPIVRTLDFDAARAMSELVGRHLMRAHPKLITMEWSVPKRTGKIFMDYNMNVRGKTLNVAYSPRGEPGAPVSMPVTWEELRTAHPLDFRMTNAISHLAQGGDKWHDVLSRKQSLEGVLSKGLDVKKG
ncbi:MAG TPA: non-homologous end-joining DNA ligase [Nevskiaceae bacterium]|nr:non-homologous end-joining DNA ligase [Nevskiaceae bacterium]